MPSRELRPSVLDSTPDNDPSATAEALRLAEEAEAEAAEAEAAAAAARARARALRLRRAAQDHQAEQATEVPDAEATGTEVTDTEVPDVQETSEAAEATGETTEEPAETVNEPTKRRRWLRRPRVPRPSWKATGVVVAIVCILGLLGVSGYLVWTHQQAEQHRHRAAEFQAAARQGVVTLMSLDHTKAKQDVQRIIDNSTGEFKKDFQSEADDFIKVAESAKVVTEASVSATAIQSMTDDNAIVLVAATSKVTNSAGAKQEPRSWRLAVSLAREGGQIKMSKVEFVP